MALLITVRSKNLNFLTNPDHQIFTAMVAVGYGKTTTGQEYFIIRNSWVKVSQIFIPKFNNNLLYLSLGNNLGRIGLHENGYG